MSYASLAILVTEGEVETSDVDLADASNFDIVVALAEHIKSVLEIDRLQFKVGGRTVADNLITQALERAIKAAGR